MLEEGDDNGGGGVDASSLQRDAAKERKKERERKERERKEAERKARALEREKEKAKEKEKEKEKEKGEPLKVKIKLPTPLSSTSSLSSISSSASSIVGINVVSAPAPVQPPDENGIKQDPALIPLPTSRSASPFPSYSNTAIQPSALLPTPLRKSHTADLDDDATAGASFSMMMTTNTVLEAVGDAIPVTTTAEATNPDDLLSTPARGQYRSPKRTFDESSASGGEDTEGRDGGEGGRERRRRRVGSLVGNAEAGSATSLVSAAGAGAGVDCGTPPPPLLDSQGMNVDVDVVDVEMDADTPGLTTSSVGDSSSSSSLSSSPLSSSLSSEAGSEVWSASASPAPEGGDDEVDMEPTTPVPASKPQHTNGMKSPKSPPSSSMKKSTRFPHPYEGGEKQLTRRQRKALGLPKQRNVPPYLASGVGGKMGTKDASPSASAGKIVIPGGRWTGRSSSSVPAVADPSGGVGVDEEWRRNGTGRLDVRGFRELKI